MLGRNIAFSNCDEAGKPCLRRKQVVEIGVKASVRQAIANRKQLAIAIEKKAEFRGLKYRIGKFGQRGKPMI